MPENVKVCFANTGKEHPATLDFVQECAAQWDIPIVWLEWTPSEKARDRWRQVNFQTASRDGEPFAGLLALRGYPPQSCYAILHAGVENQTNEILRPTSAGMERMAGRYRFSRR